MSVTITIIADQLCTGCFFTMIPFLSRSVSFAVTSLFSATGMCLEVCCTGTAEGSTTNLLVRMCLRSLKTSPKSLSILSADKRACFSSKTRTSAWDATLRGFTFDWFLRIVKLFIVCFTNDLKLWNNKTIVIFHHVRLGDQLCQEASSGTL